MDPVEIKEDGLLLRPWRPDDADDLFRASQDPDIQRWTPAPSPYLPEHATEFVTRTSPAAWATGTGALFAVCDAGTGQLLAWCGLVSIDRVRRSAEVGYWTAPWARGQAVAVRATRAVARWAFTTLGLGRITLQVEVGNHASRLVALRAGFTIDGRLRFTEPATGSRVVTDGWIGSLLPSDLARDTGAPPAGRDSVPAHRAAVFGHEQPVLFASTGDEEITLRRPETRDLDAIVIACRDPETVRWTTIPDPYERSDAEFFIGPHTHGRWARGDGAVFAIADATDAYVGSMELRLSPVDPSLADVGFMAAPHVRGRGYVPAALAAVAAWGFTALDLARIEWRANVGNTSSRRAAEKAGFVFEGTARSALAHCGQRIDAWVGALLATDPVTPRGR